MNIISHEQADARFDEILRRYEETMEAQVNARRQVRSHVKCDLFYHPPHKGVSQLLLFLVLLFLIFHN